LVTVMGLLDHRRTWQFEVKAAPKPCADAFVTAMTQSKGALSLRKANWTVRSGSDPAAAALLVATYKSRGGIGAVVTPLSEQATLTHQAAKGSALSFRVHPKGPGSAKDTTTCSLWLSGYGTRFVFFIADAPIFRSYMAEVARALRELDSGLRLAKG
jgi:hypothetical protein